LTVICRVFSYIVCVEKLIPLCCVHFRISWKSLCYRCLLFHIFCIDFANKMSFFCLNPDKVRVAESLCDVLRCCHSVFVSFDCVNSSRAFLWLSWQIFAYSQVWQYSYKLTWSQDFNPWKCCVFMFSWAISSAGQILARIAVILRTPGLIIGPYIYIDWKGLQERPNSK
jgi:hypothetical protein